MNEMHEDLSEGLREAVTCCQVSPSSVTKPNLTTEKQHTTENASTLSVEHGKIMEAKFLAGSNNTINEGCVINHDYNTDGVNESYLQPDRNLLRPLEMLEEAPPMAHQAGDSSESEQKNDNLPMPVTPSLCETVHLLKWTGVNEKKEAERCNLNLQQPQLDNSEETIVTNTQRSNDFPFSGTLVNKYELTAGLEWNMSMDLQENGIAKPEQEANFEDQEKPVSKVSQASGSSTDVQNDFSIDQCLKSDNEQTASSGENRQPLQDSTTAECGEETQTNAVQSVGDCESAILETESDTHEESQPILAEQIRKSADSGQVNECEPNPVSTTQSDTVSEVTISKAINDELEDLQPQLPRKQIQHSQDMQQSYSTDDHALHSKLISDTPTSSPSSSKDDDPMYCDTEQDTQKCDQTKSIQSSQTAAEASSAQASISTSSQNNYVGNDQIKNVKYQCSQNKSNRKPFPKSAFLRPSEVIRTDDKDDQIGEPQKLADAIMQFDICTQLKYVDIQTPALQTPAKAPIADEDSFISPEETDQNTIKFKTSANTIDANLERSDIQPGIILNRSLKMRCLKNSMTLMDVNEAIIQGEHNPPTLYVTDQAPKGKNKSEDPVEVQVEQQAGDQNTIKFKTNVSPNDTNLGRLDIEAAAMLSRLLKMRSFNNSLTLLDINGAIMQGKPDPPTLYVPDEASKGNIKSKDPVEIRVEPQADEGITQKMSWVTGSHFLSQYLCWPCLLFGKSVWQLPTSMGLGDIVAETKNHQSTVPHMSAFLKLLVHEATLKREQEAELERDLERTRKTELLLRLLIEVTCSNTKGSKEELSDTLGLVCSYKEDLQNFIKENPCDYLASFVESNQSRIRKAIEKSVMARISEEIKNVPYVAIIFEDTVDVVDRSLMSVILRYVTDSSISKERLVKLVKMGMNRTAADLLKITEAVVHEFQLTEKLVGFTYSGTVIAPRELLIFNKTVNRIYPKARFFPYQEHNFKKIIIQSLSHLPECRNFFYTISELAEFLKNDPTAIKILMEINKVDLGERKEPWDLDNDFITTIKCHYATIMSLFTHAIEHEFSWGSATVMQVDYFSRFFSSRHCRILISVISTILATISDLCNAIESKEDIEAWNRSLSEATNTLSNMKTSGLITVLQGNDTLLDASEYPDIYSLIAPEFFHQLIDTSMFVINHRCVDLELAFIGPRDIKAAAYYGPERLAVFLQRVDVNRENFCKLKNMANAFYEKQSLEGKNLEQLIEHIHDSKMTGFAHLLRYLQLCLTLPTKDSYSANSTPAILRLHSYIAKNKRPKFFDLLVFMEKEIFRSLQRKEQFYDQIIEYCT